MPANISSILQNHLWYPYKTEIIIVDSLTISLLDSNRVAYSKNTTVTNLDTTIMADNCLAGSTFKFSANGNLNITNPCNSIAPLYDTTWLLVQNVFLKSVSINDPQAQNYYYHHVILPFLFQPDSTYSFYPTQGNITVIDNSQFIFNCNIRTASFDRSYLRIDSLHKILSKEFTTYRSRD